MGSWFHLRRNLFLIVLELNILWPGSRLSKCLGECNIHTRHENIFVLILKHDRTWGRNDKWFCFIWVLIWDTGVVGGGLDEKFCYNINRDKQEKREWAWHVHSAYHSMDFGLRESYLLYSIARVAAQTMVESTR